MILVTGATGILGSVIVLDLLKQGKTVRASYRSENRLQEVKKIFSYYTDTPADFFDQIIWVKVDFEDIASLENAVDGVEEVYHCAAKVSFHPKDKLEMYETNIEGTKQLLYACQNSSVKKFCFVSSIAVLDGLNEDGIMDESSDYNHKLEHSAYAKSKHFSEMEVWRASAEGLKVVIVNPGVIIGSGNWKSSSGTLFGSLLKSPFSFSGSTAYVDVRDVSKMAILLMEKEVFDQRFILISENIKFEEMANLVRSKFGLNKVKIIPNFILKIGTIFAYLLGWLFPMLKMINKRNIEAVSTSNIISNKKITHQLNESFLPISESIDFHLNHYKKDLKKA
ncbi:MAG: NAD-dependent epimerase/dehydratase family protein [Bacteroidetes bacterium]|nr:NAD-dependent epimerase/dehydratase family protein [Bacteroidota bacterium]